MTFKDIRHGNVVYLLHKDGELRAEAGKVKSAMPPRFPEYGTNGNALGMVVDLSVEGKTYVVPADSSVASAGNVVISVDKEGILREVEAMETESEDAINAIEMHKARKSQCEKIKEEWDARFAEKREQDERIGSLEGKVDGLASLLRGFIKEMKGD